MCYSIFSFDFIKHNHIMQQHIKMRKEEGNTMKMDSFKTKLAQKIVKTATAEAHRTVGRSIPWGVHEVEVPKELKHLTENHDAVK